MYYPATVRGMEVVQFNLMHPHLTNVFNPLINSVQQFRRNNPVKGAAIIDTIVQTIFPDNGEIWNPAAGNVFRRTVYLMFDYIIEQERYLRYMARKNNIGVEILEQEIDNLYSKLTMFNIYRLTGDLASQVSSDKEFININPERPMQESKDLLTLSVDALEMLPKNDLRDKAITANNAIKQVAPAPQTLASIYATLLTGLSVYADDTAIALMSGGISESFDIAGLGFPRRFGVRFEDAFINKYRISGELCVWTCYKDSHFQEQYEGSDFLHEEKLPPTGWTWGHFAGIFENEVSYLKLQLRSKSTVIKEFYFRFTKGYKTINQISYVIDPITKQKTILNGFLEEFDPETQDVCTSTFEHNSLDYENKTYSLQQVPILTSTQVYYSERPKFVFCVTPPHLQVYQKHILIIIKQIVDEHYANSYITKPNRKPIVGLRLMLEEFGNIRSGEKGIPDMDQIASIALGQDLQITFVLQSFQQFRALYTQDVEKVIRSNSSHVIFLKSNDDELIKDLVTSSGTRHELRTSSKAVSRKLSDIVTVSEPTINLTANHQETTSLTYNDFLFLAGKSPGNAITLISGEMPIVNKFEHIMPMAAGLHKRLPQQQCDAKKGQTIAYSDSTIPTTKTKASESSYLDNVIDGTELVNALVDQARIARKVRKEVLEIAEKNKITINTENGELSNLMMKYVYEEYERQVGTVREGVKEAVQYWKMAIEFQDNISFMRDKHNPMEKRQNAVRRLNEMLYQCMANEELAHLTKYYRNFTRETVLGFCPNAVSMFVNEFKNAYPKPKELQTERQEIAYKPFDKNDPEHHQFDAMNPNHRDVLEDIGLQLIQKEIPYIEGTTLRRVDDNLYQFLVGDMVVIEYHFFENNHNSVHFDDQWGRITKKVRECPALLTMVMSQLSDSLL